MLFFQGERQLAHYRAVAASRVRRGAWNAKKTKRLGAAILENQPLGKTQKFQLKDARVLNE